jgi:hypothetical protein
LEEEGRGKSRGLQESRVERDAWKGILRALETMRDKRRGEMRVEETETAGEAMDET